MSLHGGPDRAVNVELPSPIGENERAKFRHAGLAQQFDGATRQVRNLRALHGRDVDVRPVVEFALGVFDKTSEGRKLELRRIRGNLLARICLNPSIRPRPFAPRRLDIINRPFFGNDSPRVSYMLHLGLALIERVLWAFEIAWEAVAVAVLIDRRRE